VLRFLQAGFLSWLKTTGEEPDAGEAIDTTKMTPQEIENLRSLGYLKIP